LHNIDKLTTHSEVSDSNCKNIFESLNLLHTLHKDHSAVINSLQIFDNNDVTAQLEKVHRSGFILRFEDPTYTMDLGEVLNLRLRIESFVFHLPKIFVNQIAYPKVAALVHSLHTEGFKKEHVFFYRLYIPLKRKLSFHFLIEESGYTSERHVSRECVSIQYDKVLVDSYLYHDRNLNKSYLIIDSPCRLDYRTFSDYCFSTLVALGYVCGQFPQDEGYYFAYDAMEMKTPAHVYYSEFRPSLKSMYTPMYGNAYGYINDKGLAAQVYPTLRPLSAVEFSNLCKWTFRSVEFSSILLLVIEACASSLLLMPSGLSIALEGLTDLLVQQRNNMPPIRNKPVANEIRKQLGEVIDKYRGELDDDALSILKTRVNNINQLTNRAKLTKPFELLGFSLTPEDLKAIEHRNNFLHGRITLDITDNKNRGDEIYYISLRLYTLLAVLILKSCGFDNKICNYPKIHEQACGKDLNEPFFRSL
jgi:hypothetical protein